MPFKRTALRYAHTNGHTVCTYSEDGKVMITCGSDGDIRTWEGIDDDDPTSKCLGEFLLALKQYDQRLLVANDLNMVQAYTFPDIDKDGIEFRFGASANTIAVNREYIAAGSEDTIIKIIKKDKTEIEFELKDHKGPILHIDLSKDNYLASSSGDGTIKIWNLLERKEVKTIKNLTKINTFEVVKYFGSPSFEPVTGRTLAYPHGKEIILLNCNTWETQTTLTDTDNITSDYTFCSYSCCGEYLAAGTECGEISVWDVQKRQTIKGETKSREPQSITCIVWNPNNNGEFAYCDATGQLGTVVGCKRTNIQDGKRKVAAASENFLDNEAEEDADDDNENHDDLFGNGVDAAGSEFDGIEFKDDDDEDDENVISLEKLKNDTMRANGILDDDDADFKELNADAKSYRSASIERVVVKNFQQQTAFQSTSTPSNLEHRYLVWNNVGIVKAFTSDAEASIDVEFHDVSTHHALHMNNYLEHTMASLSSTVLALSGDKSSKLVCITLGGTVGSREWSFELPDCEGVVAIAATTKYVAVGTDARFLRIFSVMGTQREVLSIPGPIVALTGYEDKIMITYHRSPASEDQHISAMLLQLFGLTLRCREISIIISPGKKLTWIGYSDRGSPVTCDTIGVVQMYSNKTNSWYPVCNTMKHTQSVSNNFFIIDVSESCQIIQAVLCRGASYPMTNPRPTVMELPMQIPVCEIETEKSMLEESLVRHSNFYVENSERMIKEDALKLFSIACRTEMEARAKELIEMIASPELLPMAVKYASKLGRIHLADKLSELLPTLEEQEKEREKEIRDMENEGFNILQNSPLNPCLMLMHKQKSNTVPQIAPKPMVLSATKRNPFKRSSITPTNKKNPLSHLTDKAIGFSEKKTIENSVEIDGIERLNERNITPPPIPLTNNTEDMFNDTQNVIAPTNKENKAQNIDESNSKTTFMSWFTANKEELICKHSTLTPQELTKIAMKEYKMISAVAGPSKRKLDDDSEQKQSGIAKLAKFGFKQ